MNDITLALLESILGLVFAIGGAILIPLLQKFLAGKIGADKTNRLLTLAQTVVNMAEQQLGSGKGDQKKELALAALQGFANRDNLKLDAASMHAAIEAAVLQLKAAKASEPPPVAAQEVK